ncbi:MaoC family dehydratase [Pseudoclavibacter endophyticus]|uniref:MaoC family dehydratase n=1 Tax=Pseudoclavibacter endophyticus TaxID=1778590 RepID=A0A6H9WTQ2_9MICO|nr:MaoC family dehydratase [Pseudoclavibacter endophyticus]KAB1649640.1 MaoC family dehydratase [Pseudoclavibacter endophyticus]GGA61002.1 MaoC family dehydratase [Pseudoclavibacter endophyticus]
MTDTETTTFVATIDDLDGAEGTAFGPSSWREITQDDIDTYADLTGDDNPIHVDADAAAASPFGTRIAHGMLTLGMVVRHLREIYRITDTGTGIVYGFNRIRFPAPVPSGGRIRVRGTIANVTAIDGGVQVALELVYELEGGGKPVTVAELVLRHLR